MGGADQFVKFQISPVLDGEGMPQRSSSPCSRWSGVALNRDKTRAGVGWNWVSRPVGRSVEASDCAEAVDGAAFRFSPSGWACVNLDT
jgi:hypothetical protein